MARKRRKGEINCTCLRYPFVHRLYGGDCVGRRFVYLHFEDQAYGDCQGCHFIYQDEEYGEFRCQVLEGTEDTWQCPAMQEILHSNEVPVPKKFGFKRWP